jgi:hypothetical protein
MSNINDIKTELLTHAIHFLEGMEMFHPFGLALFEGNKLHFHGVGEDDLVNLPSSEELIKRVTSKLINYLVNEDALCIGVAINSEFTKNDALGKVKTIEMRILNHESEELFTYYIYQIVNSKAIILGETDSPWNNLSQHQN